MKEILKIIFCINVFLFPLNAQKIIVEWQKTFGGKGNDRGYFAIQEGNGDILIVGNTTSFGAKGKDIYLIKIDENGNKIFEKVIKSVGNERPYCIINSQENEYLIVGRIDKNSEYGKDIFFLKIGKNGNEILKKTIGNKNRNEWGYCVIPVEYNSYLIAGGFSSPNKECGVYLVKTDKNGNVLYEKTIKKGKCAWVRKIQPLKNREYLMLGQINYLENSKKGIYLLKLDSSLNKISEKIAFFDLKIPVHCVHDFFFEEENNSVIVIGYQILCCGEFGENIFFIKLDNKGNRLLKKVLGGEGNENVFRIIKTKDGKFLLAGYTSSKGAGYKDVYIIKINNKGKNMERGNRRKKRLMLQKILSYLRIIPI